MAVLQRLYLETETLYQSVDVVTMVTEEPASPLQLPTERVAEAATTLFFV